LNPLTDTEKAYFDTIKQVAQSARPRDLALQRMELDGRDVAVIVQRVIDSETAAEVGWQPLAILIEHETADRLRDPEGRGPRKLDPSGLEGAAGDPRDDHYGYGTKAT